MNFRTKVLETLSGTGQIVPKEGGEPIRVRYQIQVLQKMLDAGGGEYIPGVRTIEGRIQHVSDDLFQIRSVGKHFVLTIDDGRRLTFFFRDQYGSIAPSGGLQSTE